MVGPGGAMLRLLARDAQLGLRRLRCRFVGETGYRLVVHARCCTICVEKIAHW